MLEGSRGDYKTNYSITSIRPQPPVHVVDDDGVDGRLGVEAKD